MPSNVVARPVEAASSESIREIAVIVSKLRSGSEKEKYPLLLGRLEELLDDDLLLRSWKSPLWNETVSLAASGKILSAAAQAGADQWFANGYDYSHWLGRNITKLLKANASLAASQVCQKALTLGHVDSVIESVLSNDPEYIRILVETLPSHDQRRTMHAILSTHAKLLQSKKISIVESCTLISSLIATPALRSYLVSWLTRELPVAPTSLYKSAIKAVADNDINVLEDMLLKTWESFGDKLAIKHMPIIQQEAVTQILLVSAGYIHRQDPARLKSLARSSIHTTAITARLASSSLRIRFLGMVVGVAISGLIDNPESKLTFGSDELNTEESRWYQNLLFEDIPEPVRVSVPPQIKNSKPRLGTGPRIVEIIDNEDEDDDDDLVSYGKLDDPEDEDDDPTLVQHHKPTAPKYIRDLVAGLNDTEDYDRHRLALTSAASLIRQKAAFGSELKDRCEELASILVGLSDKFNIEGFQQLRADALVSTLIAEPQQMGRWYARSYFSGDYSISQRGVILSTLGMGARELAGFHETETEKAVSPGHQFPSQKLPKRLHSIYSEASLLENLAHDMEQHIVQPLALNAADELSGPNALKVRKFSSRLAPKTNSKTIIRSSAKFIPNNIFFPLAGYWSAQLSSSFSSPLLLPLYLKTLAVILITCGTTALSLSQMTSEFWNLLLSVRTIAQSDQAILEATLFGLLAVLSVNEDKRRLAQTHGKQLVETHEWADSVFDRLDGRDEESGRARSLAASVLVQTKETLEAHHRLLLGDMIDL